MKVAHFARVSPNQCGMYETAKEMVLAERLAGIDAGMIHYDGQEHKVLKDGSFKSEKLSWADDADILVRHTAIPDRYQNSGKPVVMALHGRPESSFRLEESGTSPIITAIHNKGKDARYKKFITFWEEYVPFWKLIVPEDKVEFVPAMVDVQNYRSNEKFDLGQWKSDINILICDIWRDDVIPLNSILGAVEYCRGRNARVHIVGMSKKAIEVLTPMLESFRREGLVGYIGGITRQIRNFYSACQIVVSPHVIETRSIREAKASGCKVVTGKDCNHMISGDVADAIRKCVREEQEYKLPTMKSVGLKIKKIFESILPNTKDKVLIDLGGHLGETVRRFYREKPNAEEYRIFTFEADPETSQALHDRVGYIDGVEVVNLAVSDKNGTVTFYKGKSNDNEGGTTLNGKITGKVDYSTPIMVDCVRLTDWLDRLKAKEIILKMNIEGGEYAIMQDLIDTGKLAMIDKCYIQTHAHKFDKPICAKNIEQKFTEECKKHGVELYMKKKGFYAFE